MHIQRLLPLLFLLPLAAGAQTPCIDGEAGDFSCQDVDLLAHLSQAELGSPGASGNDIWGWTDPDTGKEYALMGLSTGTVFVDVSTPTTPVVIGTLPAETSSSNWRDIKTIGNYAYVGSEASGHGIQVFDLTRLRDVTSPPETFDADAHYSGIGQSHNIVALDEAELIIPVGAYGECSAGLNFIDVSDPLNPTHLGCDQDEQNSYVHDAQCVRYDGPDTDYTGHDICFTARENFASIVDISDPSNPVRIARMFYPNTSYTHQGWLTEDQAWFIVNDETGTGTTETMFFDVSDLVMADLAYKRYGPTQATDHNLYIRDGLMYQTNYRIGLRLWNVSTLEDEDSVNEIAWFDTYPENDDWGFDGTWSNYPFFESGIVVVSDIDRGLFVLQPIFRPVTTSMSFSAPSAEPEEVVTLTASLTNQEDAPFSGLEFSNTLPEGLTFDGNITASAGSASEADGTVTWDVDLAVGATETISFDVLIDSGTSGGNIQNTATITLPGENPYDVSASILVQARPANDDYEDAIALTESGTYDGTNVDATTEDDVPTMTCGFGNRIDVWWSFTAAADGMVTISTQGSGFDTVLGLHDASLSELGCNDDNGSGGLWSLLEDVPVTEGETYLLRIAGYSSAEGTIQFELDAPFAVADEASPQEIAERLSAPNPNPASGTSMFTVAVEHGQDVTVEVFDVTGRRVRTLHDGTLAAGMSKTLELDASTLPAGVYMIRATGQDFSKTQRVTVVR